MFNKVRAFFKKTVSIVKKSAFVAVASVVTLMSAPVLASDPVGASITAAVDAAKANMTLVTVGVLTVAAIGFGIGLVTSFLRR